MKYKKYFEKLFINKPKISKLDILFILKKLDFHKTFLIFHVGGTNGKGSVSNYLQQGFIRKYNKVGLLTSPHITKLNERIKINNKEIDDLALYQYCEKILNINKNVPFPTLMYIASLLYFKDQGIQLAIIEVGIGGRYDDTKIINGEYGVITSVSLDHIEILGNSIKKIALDKAGVMTKNMIYFLPTSMSMDIRNIFIHEAKLSKSKIINIDCDRKNYKAYNKSLSKSILEFFGIKNIIFKEIFGRTSFINYRGIKHIIDVAHNYSGIEASLEYLSSNNIKYTNICLSLSKDKDITEIKTLFDTNIYVYSNNSYKSMSLSDYPIGIKVKNLKIFINNLAKPTLFIGSFYFIGDIMEVINE